LREGVEIGLPDAVRGRSAHIYRYLMREWFNKLDEGFKANLVVSALFFLVSILYAYVGSWVGGAIK